MISSNSKMFFVCFLILSTSVRAQYYTGQKVFVNKFPTEISDNKQDTYIQINNSDGDIIVAVEQFSSGRVIRHAYIKSNDSYKFKNIPVGSFICKYMWTDRYGNKHFNKDNESMQFKANEVGGYVITMEKSVGGNLTQSGISEADFFN
ncbi:hypothetical protein N9D29_05535 [Flavobacteriaceae bacterium]|nr:hypothetical protein [Flavobacteriaceae bacterium]|tara:strand:+ start:578 stop:1021 length:444 start_codon:yes stop_codon:yes gene_type:complete